MLRVRLGAGTVLELEVAHVDARRIALLAHVGPAHLADHPQNAAAYSRALADEVAAAIGAARGPSALCKSLRQDPAVQVEVELEVTDGGHAGGGAGAWPGGGGGGGGGAMLDGAGSGGAGADGAVAIIQWSEDGTRFSIHLGVLQTGLCDPPPVHPS